MLHFAEHDDFTKAQFEELLRWRRQRGKRASRGECVLGILLVTKGVIHARKLGAPATTSSGLAYRASALRMNMLSLMHPDPPNLPEYPAPDFTASEGHVRYVGPPSDCTESDNPPTTFKCASLQCAPYYADWGVSLGGQVLRVSGPEIVPSSSYTVDVITQDCLSQNPNCMFTAGMPTGRWGDVAPPFQAPSPAPLSQPNIADVAAMVDKFRGLAAAIPVARADVNPAIPDRRVDIADVAADVDAFKGKAYPYSGPANCP